MKEEMVRRRNGEVGKWENQTRASRRRSVENVMEYDISSIRT